MNRRDFLKRSVALLGPFAAGPRLLHAQSFYTKQMENGTIYAADPHGGNGLPDLEPLSHGIILGRPTDTSICAQVMATEDMYFFLEYGIDPQYMVDRTDTITLPRGQTAAVTVDGLDPNTRYYYCIWKGPVGANACEPSDLFSFHTQRPPGTPFTFVVQADPHLDEQSIPELYERTLINESADNPDFVIDLGDTPMSDKVRPKTYELIEKRYLLQQSYFSLLCHSVPLLLVLGNHDAEAGWECDGTAENLAVWSTLLRKKYFPNPLPDGFYTGSQIEEEFVGLRQNYYAWQWGDALFVVLDPYWYTKTKPGEKANAWAWTLGEEQYNWFKQTIKDCNAPFKFVFCHQLIGGNSQGRGGVEWVPYYEMGGYNIDGTWGFDQHRPTWDKPIHQLMVENNVTIFFHGHDHFFAKQELDGIIYQLVPQPSHHNFKKANQAAAYGYESGDILPSSGHLRVTIIGSQVTVDYVRAYLPESEDNERINGQVSHTYHIEHPIDTYTVK